MASSAVSRPNLWEVALSKLPEKEQKELRSGLNSRGSFEINDLTTTVSQLQQQVFSERWHVKLGHRELDLRHVLDSIVSWVKKFIAIGDIAVQYDPAHAALPWAALRFVLQALVNNSSRAAAYAKGLERVALYIYDCAIRETLYLNGTHGVQTRLESSIVRLYTTMLDFMYRAKKHFETRATKRVISSPFKSEDEPLAFLQSVEQQASDIMTISGLIDSQIQSELGTDTKGVSVSLLQSQARLRQQIEETQRIREILVSNQTETISRFDNIDHRARQTHRLKILRWLSSVPYREHHQREIAEVLENTGSWFLESQTFTSWKSSHETAMMWLHGAPGTGKSKLMSLALQSTLEECGHIFPALYFYCSRTAAEPERANAEDILRCLVKELSTGNPGHETEQVPEYVAEKYEAAEEIDFASGKMTAAECRSITARFGNLHQKLYIFIDALDELEESMQHDLIESLKTIMKDASKSYVKVLISSRDNTSVVPSFSQQKAYELAVNSGENQNDIDSYVKTQLATLIEQKRIYVRGKAPSQELQQDIINALCAKSQGMFRWVSLQLDYLCTLHSENDVFSRLGRLPRQLSDSYEAIWAQKTEPYEAEDMNRLDLALSLLLVRYTPTPAVFARFIFGDDDCIEIDSNTGEVLTEEQVGGSRVRKEMRNDPLLEMVTKLCFGLVFFDETTNSFRFAHISVEEYIMSHKHGYRSLSEIHARIAKRCMSVLVEPESVVDSIHAFTNRLLWPEKGGCKQPSTMFPVGIYVDRSPETSTIDWVSMQWAYYVANSNEIRQSSSLKDLEARLQNLVDETPWESLDPSVFFSACTFNNLQLVKKWLSHHPKFALLREDIGKSTAITALHFAAFFDNPAVAECLIDAGASLDGQCSSDLNTSFSTPLHVAITSGSLNIIPLLLQKRDQTRVDHRPFSNENTFLLNAAIRTGNEDIVHALLDHGFSPSAGNQNGSDPTPLGLAIDCQLPRVLQMLIDRGASVHEKSHPITECGPERICLQMPLLRAIEVDDTDDGESVRVLLKAGADPRVIDRGFSTPLGLSTALNRKNLVRILIEFGADVNDPMDMIRLTPLFISIIFNNDELTKLLLAAGADPNITNVFDATALWAAIMAGNDKLTKLLLAAGADPNITTLHGQSALMLAAEAGNLGAVKSVLPTTTNLNIQNINSETALSKAAEKGHQAIVETLLDKGAEIEPQEPGPHCPFMDASERKGGFAKSALASALYSRDDATFRSMLRFSAKSETRAMEQEMYDKVLCSLDVDGWDSFNALYCSETVTARLIEYRSNGKTDEEAHKSLLTTSKSPFCHFAMTLISNDIEKNMQNKNFVDQTRNQAHAIEKRRKEKFEEQMEDL